MDEEKITEEIVSIDIKAEKKYLLRVWIAYAAFILINSGAQLLCALVEARISTDWLLDHYVIGVTLPSYVITLPLLLLLLKGVKPYRIEDRSLNAVEILGAFLACYACIFTGGLVGTLISEMLPVPDVSQELGDMITNSNIIEIFISVVFIGPVFEELVFRKLLIDRLGRYGGRVAVIVSAVMFGLYHGNVTQFAYATLAGLVLGYVYAGTGRVVYTMILHTLINFTGSIVPMMIMEDDTKVAMFSLVTLAFAAAGLVLIMVNVRRLSFSKGIEIQKRWKLVLLNISALLYLAVTIGLAVYTVLQY